MNQKELVKLAHQALAEPNEDSQCSRCGSTMHNDPELEPSALCNLCAQTAAVELADGYLKRIKR